MVAQGHDFPEVELAIVERDYGAVGQKWAALGPLVESAGTGAKGVTWKPAAAVEYLARSNGRVRFS